MEKLDAMLRDLIATSGNITGLRVDYSKQELDHFLSCIAAMRLGELSISKSTTFQVFYESQGTECFPKASVATDIGVDGTLQ